ncbi:MAG: hypothetical protein ACOCXT_03990 [Candidatus Dojkabacteria bacterium]
MQPPPSAINESSPLLDKSSQGEPSRFNLKKIPTSIPEDKNKCLADLSDKEISESYGILGVVFASVMLRRLDLELSTGANHKATIAVQSILPEYTTLLEELRNTRSTSGRKQTKQLNDFLWSHTIGVVPVIYSNLGLPIELAPYSAYMSSLPAFLLMHMNNGINENQAAKLQAESAQLKTSRLFTPYTFILIPDVSREPNTLIELLKEFEETGTIPLLAPTTYDSHLRGLIDKLVWSKIPVPSIREEITTGLKSNKNTNILVPLPSDLMHQLNAPYNLIAYLVLAEIIGYQRDRIVSIKHAMKQNVELQAYKDNKMIVAMHGLTEALMTYLPEAIKVPTKQARRERQKKQIKKK